MEAIKRLKETIITESQAPYGRCAESVIREPVKEVLAGLTRGWES